MVLAACESHRFAIAAECNPLGANHCLTPWPSSAFEVDDATSETGRRLAVPATAMPINDNGVAIDATPWNLADGFSPAAPIVMAFPGGVSSDGLPPNDDYDLSLSPSSPTVILDMTTGQRVAHFAEIDEQADDTPDSQALFLRPAARLIGGHRYAVAITKLVKARDGSELVSPPGFRALVSNTPTSHPLLEAMRPRFADVLAALDSAGFPTQQLVMAWDFTVASDDFLHRDMIAARDRTLAALANHPIAYTITSDAPIDDGSEIKRELTGTLDAPLFLSNGGGFAAGTVIMRDGDGLPTTQGFYQIPFTAIVPACAYDASAPVAMVMYGHGLMGDSIETAGAVQSTTASELCMVFVGTNMRGMSGDDLPAVAMMLNDLSRGDEVFEKIEQGLVNHITLAQAMRTTLAQTLFVDAANGNKPLVDPTQVFYYGLSQGGIFGASVMAYEPTITRAALGVGAANYSLLLERSNDWPIYRVVLSGAYTDPLDDTLAINLMQMRWDKVEPSGIANTVLQGTATGVPPKQLLLQNAIGDDEVANLATYWEARTMGLPVLGPTPVMPWGLTVQASPMPGGSTLVMMDGGAPQPPTIDVPAAATGMHDLTRNQPAARRQIGDFFRTGQLVDECDGPCICQSGECQ